MCFTVEIDKKHFPDAKCFVDGLNEKDILYMSNENDFLNDNSQCLCCRFEIDEKSAVFVCDLLAELVKSNYIRFFTYRILNANYARLTTSDIEHLTESVVSNTDTKRISMCIYKFVSENMHIHLGGFVYFRMKDYFKELEDEIDFEVDEYMRHKDYCDFVGFLKFFVEMEETSVELVNVVVDRYGEYKILDSLGTPICKEALDSTYCEISSFEDNSYILLNDLVSLSPKRIVFHYIGDNDKYNYIDIISEIFGKRVSICNGCSLCEKSR